MKNTLGHDIDSFDSSYSQAFQSSDSKQEHQGPSSWVAQVCWFGPYSTKSDLIEGARETCRPSDDVAEKYNLNFRYK